METRKDGQTAASVVNFDCLKRIPKYRKWLKEERKLTFRIALPAARAKTSAQEKQLKSFADAAPRLTLKSASGAGYAPKRVRQAQRRLKRWKESHEAKKLV